MPKKRLEGKFMTNTLSRSIFTVDGHTETQNTLQGAVTQEVEIQPRRTRAIRLKGEPRRAQHVCAASAHAPLEETP